MYVFESRVRYSEIGPNGKLTMENLINYFQDVSTLHSDDLGIGVEYCTEHGIVWLMSYWQIEVVRFPSLSEKIHVKTAPYEFKGFMGLRNFVMTTENEEILAYANSLWTLVNFEKMIPARPTAEMLERYVLEPKFDMEYLERKIRVPEGGKSKEEIVVKPHHLDTNKHVNNGQYIAIAMECVSREKEVKRLRAEYKKSAMLHDVIYPVVTETDRIVTVSLNAKDGQPYCIVELSY